MNPKRWFPQHSLQRFCKDLVKGIWQTGNRFGDSNNQELGTKIGWESCFFAIPIIQRFFQILFIIWSQNHRWMLLTKQWFGERFGHVRYSRILIEKMGWVGQQWPTQPCVCPLMTCWKWGWYLFFSTWRNINSSPAPFLLFSAVPVCVFFSKGRRLDRVRNLMQEKARWGFCLVPGWVLGGPQV